MPDFRRIKQAKAVFSQHIKAGKSVETAIVNTAHHTGVLIEDIMDTYNSQRLWYDAAYRRHWEKKLNIKFSQ